MTFIYSQPFIHHSTGLFGTNTVTRALYRYRRGHGFKSRTGLIFFFFFFRPSFRYCLSSVHYCEDRFHIHVFIRSSNIWLSYIHSRKIQTVLHHWYITWQNDSLLLERSSKILRTLAYHLSLLLSSIQEKVGNKLWEAFISVPDKHWVDQEGTSLSEEQKDAHQWSSFAIHRSRNRSFSIIWYEIREGQNELQWMTSYSPSRKRLRRLSEKRCFLFFFFL